MTQATARILPVAAILAAGAVMAVWVAGDRDGPLPATTAALPAQRPASGPAPVPAAPQPAPSAAQAARPVPGATAEAPRAVPREATADSQPPAEPTARRTGTQDAAAPRRAADAPRLEPPRFDVVRVGARGNAVIAGRASPGAEVMLFDGVREIGRARADSRGEWVILPADPVGSGARELSLRARLPGGDEVAGADTVLVVGPAVVAEASPAPTETRPIVPDARPAVRAEAPQRVPATDVRPSADTVTPQVAGAQVVTSQAAASQAAASQAGTPRTAGPQAVTSQATTQQAAAPAPTASAAVTPEPRPAAPTAAPPSPRMAEAAIAPPAAASTSSAAARPAEAPTVILLPPTTQGGARPLSPGAGTGVVALGLDVVDYDDSNTMRFAGSAPPGAQLRVYSDDRHLGDAQADAAGRWTLAPEQAPAVGRHTLRVDQLAEAGPARVASRIEVPFQREALPASFVRDGRVVVQPGNNLWRIAREAYGRGTRYTVIYRANQGQIRNPSLIYPGQVFAVPTVADGPAR